MKGGVEMAEFENNMLGRYLLLKGIIEISSFVFNNGILRGNIVTDNYFPKSEYVLQLEKRVEELQRELRAKDLIFIKSDCQDKFSDLKTKNSKIH